MLHHKEAIAYKQGYRIDEQGNAIGLRGLPLIPVLDHSGYPKFTLRYNKVKTTSIHYHRLAAYQKYGDLIYNKDIEVRHLDSNKENASLFNIAIGSRSENQMDKSEETRKRCAKQAANVLKSLSDGEVRQLREDAAKGMTNKQLRQKYCIAKSTVSYIVNRKTYADVN